MAFTLPQRKEGHEALTKSLFQPVAKWLMVGGRFCVGLCLLKLRQRGLRGLGRPLSLSLFFATSTCQAANSVER